VGGFFMSVRPSSWNHRKPSTSKLLYILVYNSFWLAPVVPRLTIVLVAGKLLGVVGIASHGSNMGFDGENELCTFQENGRRHGTANVSGRERFPSFIRRSFSPKHEATNQQDRPTWGGFQFGF